MAKTVAQEIAMVCDARNYAIEHKRYDLVNARNDILDMIEREALPSGSGIDNGCTIDRDESTGDRIIINLGFHHMDENGYYCGWSSHTATITASIAYGLMIDIDSDFSGLDPDDIDEDTSYLSGTLRHALEQPAPAYDWQAIHAQYV